MSPTGAGGRRTLLIVVSIAVVVSVVAGMLLLGSPGEERRRRLDERRVDDLQELRSRIAERFKAQAALPTSLEDLGRTPGLAAGRTDPASGAPYGYAVIDARSFRLCATFDFATPNEPARTRYEPWAHRAGRQCYRFRIDSRATFDRDITPAPLIEEEAADSTP